MREVFVDTSGWVALKHKGDTFWQAATTLHRALLTAGARYVTSNFVLDESCTLLVHRAGQYHLKNPWLKAHAVAGCQQGGTRA